MRTLILIMMLVLAGCGPDLGRSQDALIASWQSDPASMTSGALKYKDGRLDILDGTALSAPIRAIAGSSYSVTMDARVTSAGLRVRIGDGQDFDMGQLTVFSGDGLSSVAVTQTGLIPAVEFPVYVQLDIRPFHVGGSSFSNVRFVQPAPPQ